MRVGIVGAGALGSTLGALLVESGADVVFIRKERDQVRLIQDNGLWIEGVSGERRLDVNIVADPSDAGKVDMALVLVKAYDTASAVPAVETILAEDGVVLTLQNGLGNFEALEGAFPGRTLLGITTMGALSLGDGKFRHTGFGKTLFGEPDGTVKPRTKAVHSLLAATKAGDVQIVENAVGCLWSKVIINAAINAPATLLRLKNGDLPKTEAGRELIHGIVRECLQVVEAKGVKLIFEDPESQVIEVCRGTAENLNSMYQDIRAERRTEIDFINQAVALEAESLGLDACVNKTLALLVNSLEKTADERVRESD